MELQNLKDFTSIFGPIIGFILGIFTIPIKQKLDDINDAKKMVKLLNQLNKLVRNCRPPDPVDHIKTNSGMITAEEVRIITSINKFNTELIPIKAIIEFLDNSNSLKRNLQKLIEFHTIKYYINIIAGRLEAYGKINDEGRRINIVETIEAIQSAYEELIKTLDGKGLYFKSKQPNLTNPFK